MALSVYFGRRYDPSRFMKLATALNIAAAIAVVFAWQLTGHVLAEPVSAAALDTMSPTKRPALMATPYVYMWLGPLVASFIAWIVYKLEYKMLGRFIIAYPALIFASALVWYHAYHMA